MIVKIVGLNLKNKTKKIKLNKKQTKTETKMLVKKQKITFWYLKLNP
jgi:hypothetical protein